MKQSSRACLAWCLLLVAALLGCRSAGRPTATGAATAPAPVVAGLQPIVTLVTPSGKSIQVVDTGEVDSYESDAVASDVVARLSGDNFEGTARRAAKLSISSGALETFGSVQELFDTLEADDDMINRQPKISHSATSRRVSEERRNVSIDTLLVAASREDDNDFHLIVCDEPTAAPEERFCLNVEISGLPTGGVHKAKLTAARNQFKAIVGGQVPGSRYVTYAPPIAVTVSGSLFYDISHPPGAVGPKAFKPATSWEIHPITAIVER
jgi:hypothetical protein